VSEPPQHRNGITAALSAASETLMRVLPPGFIVLVILNGCFLIAVLWIVQDNAEYRNAMLTKIVEQCLQQKR
jgi:hypothetical protein